MEKMVRNSSSTQAPVNVRVKPPVAAMPVTQLLSSITVRVVEGRLVPVRAVVAHAA